MAIKGFADNPQQAFTPALTDWMSIQQGELLENMKKITYEDLMQPLQGQIDSLDDDKADKDTDAVAGNFAYFDGEGNPVDSGHKDADYEDADVTILKQANVVDALDSTSIIAPLSANQGKVLKDTQDLMKGAGWTNENLVGIDNRINNLIIESGTSDAEVIDARLSGITGVLYSLLKNRLDTMETRSLVFNESNIPIATIKFRMSGSQPQLVTEEL